VPATLIAAAVPACFALIVGRPLMRLSGLAAGIATLALLVIVYTVISQWTSLTGGLTSFVHIPTDTGLYTALGWALLAMTAVYAFQRSRTGLRLRASREDELAATSVGINVTRERLAAFVASAAIVGVSGALYAHYLGAISSTLFYFQITFLTLAMLVVGGISTLAGAVVGTIVIAAVGEMLSLLEVGPNLGFVSLPAIPGLTEVGLALVMLGCLLLFPRGLTGGREIVWPFGKWPRRLPRPVERTGQQVEEVAEGAAR
jgi:branched-chain amino acid transport system permease protein